MLNFVLIINQPLPSLSGPLSSNKKKVYAQMRDVFEN
jgi:hypothetical protein